MMPLDVITLGQVFTELPVVEAMLALRQNSGRVLEPSCGSGAFSRHIPGCVALELDSRVCPSHGRVMDFFDYPVAEQFETVIGNPPYVRFNDIPSNTRSKLDPHTFDNRANLYLFFIEKAVRHLKPGGELIFITPRDFAKATSARRLNEFLHQSGTFSHFEELGDARVFPGFSPNCVIFRYVKGDLSHRLADGRHMLLHEGQLLFSSFSDGVPLASLFSVKVGAVSGADALFEHELGNLELVCSKTVETGNTKRMFYNLKHPLLECHKTLLLSRKIRAFNENSWWQWGRGYPLSAQPRVYVNAKTRRPYPFFTHPCTAFDGSVLALFPLDSTVSLQSYVALLNDMPWSDLGFVCNGRHLFSQRSLETCLIPRSLLQSMGLSR
jgi:adenine-specific DNA-methyltransferase